MILEILKALLFIAVVLALGKPLGLYVARVYEGDAKRAQGLFGVPERLIHRILRNNPEKEMAWMEYTWSVLTFSALGFVLLYAIQRLQMFLPLNPAKLHAVESHTAFNTAASFVTNTDWQSYTGERTMSHLTQMAGLAVQNFLSAATGMAVLAALIRGFSRQGSRTVGNFYVDVIRSVLYILLPLATVLALLLISQGVVQSLAPPRIVMLLHPFPGLDGAMKTRQVIPLGPAASQIAIKQLGTNGGGFFGANGSHPFENPTPISGFLELVSILLIPAALCFTFGRMVKDARQGRAILAAMLILFTVFLAATFASERLPVTRYAGVDMTLGPDRPGGNMEGKEVRFGIMESVLWATATTAASNGSVNSMHDSFTPLGGLFPMLLIQLGEVVFGGVGSGLYGMLSFAILTVFIAGLMVGRTPEYLGKKIEPFEMKMASLVALVPPLLTLLGTAAAVVAPSTAGRTTNPSHHGFSEVLYAFSSAANNNGSAYAGLAADTPFLNISLGLAMFFGRFWTMIPVLAMAGSLAAKNRIPPTAGTLETHSPLFVALLLAVVIAVGALSFIPALSLGPIVEHIKAMTAAAAQGG